MSKDREELIVFQEIQEVPRTKIREFYLRLFNRISARNSEM